MLTTDTYAHNIILLPLTRRTIIITSDDFYKKLNERESEISEVSSQQNVEVSHVLLKPIY